MKLLYVTWDGPEERYLEALFFPVFSQLRDRGVETRVLQFSFGAGSVATELAAERLGIAYERHLVRRTPIQIATVFAIAVGARIVAQEARRHGIDVIMPRSHIPGAMALLARRLGAPGKLVWDSDGLMPDERLEFGGWTAGGANYRAFTAIERALVKRTDRIICRTTKAAKLLGARGGRADSAFSVVPNGKDSQLFSPPSLAARATKRASLGLPTSVPVLIHVGSLGPQYRPHSMARCFAKVRARCPDAHLLVLTGSRDLARRALQAEGLPESSFTIQSVLPSEVPAFIQASDVGFSFREPSVSMQAVCPIKVAEYLLCGVPVLANAGIGDLDEQLGGQRAVVLAPDFTEASLDRLAALVCDEILPHRGALAEQARKLGLRLFSLEVAANGYFKAMEAVLRVPPNSQLV